MIIRVVLTILLSLTLLEAALAGFLPRAFEADFVQEKRSKLSKQKVKTNLAIKYEYPSNFYLKEQEENTLYICNAEKVWVYNPPFMEGEKGFLRTGASNKYCFSKIFDSLKKGLTDNPLYKVKKLKGNAYSIHFEAKAKKQLGLDKMQISFRGKESLFKNVKQMKLFYTGEKYPLLLTPKNLKVMNKFPKKTFKFNVPKNTEIQKMK